VRHISLVIFTWSGRGCTTRRPQHGRDEQSQGKTKDETEEKGNAAQEEVDSAKDAGEGAGVESHDGGDDDARNKYDSGAPEAND
jgi:hypothetical protein